MKTPIQRLGRLILRVFPRDFRYRFGDDIADHISTRSREIRRDRGRLGVIRFWIKSAFDILRTAAAERRDEREMQKAGRPAKSVIADLGLDVRFALRTLRRTPGFTLVALTTLALGIGAATAMFSVLNMAMMQSLPFPDSEELVFGRSSTNGRLGWISGPNYLDYRDQSDALESLAAMGLGSFLVTVTGGDEPQQARMVHATSDLFETLGVNPFLGRASTLEELPEGGGGEIVISYGFWQRWFGGSPDVLGQSLSVRGDLMTVVGVMPAGFRFLYDTDIWTPPWAGNSDPTRRLYNNWEAVGRLGPGVTLEAARAEMDLISAGLQEAYPDVNQNRDLQLDHLQSAMVEGYQSSLLLLVGAIVLVLLIACGNVANLLLARGSTRVSELAVRAALGAARSRITRQLLVECLILGLAAGGLGVLMAVWFQELILGFVSMDLLGIENLGLSVPMLGIALALSLATVLLFGVFPSFAVARANPATDLKDGARGSTSRGGIRFRSGLVILQVAFSLILLVGSGLLIRSLARLREVDPGFRVENLLTASVALPSGKYLEGELQTLFFQTLRDEILALPGVETVGVVSRLPFLQRYGNAPLWAPERPPESQGASLTADQRIVLPGYFETMEIPLVAGRLIEKTDAAGSRPVVILNRATAEDIFPDESPLGRQVAVDVFEEEPGLFEVVGVVEDHQLNSLAGSPRRAIFFPFAQRPQKRMRLAVGASIDPTNLIRLIQEELWELDGDIVLTNPQTMEQVLSDSVGGTRSITAVLGLFATVALGLAALGLYGVLTFFVTQRIHEIGIRLALGASGGSVLRLVVHRGMLLVGGGSLLGIAGAIGATRLVEGMLFQMSPTDPVTYLGVTGLFILVALGACLLPAWRAQKVDPIQAMRRE